ncbi:MAG: hypothetical protein ACM3UN_04760 [Bacillota bacterium]
MVTLEAYEEHDVGRKIVNDIDDSTDNEVKLAKIKVLSEAINQHVEEEEGELFRKAKKVLSSEDEHEIGRLFMNEKMEKTPKM